jgi:hypothetical protein
VPARDSEDHANRRSIDRDIAILNATWRGM